MPRGVDCDVGIVGAGPYGLSLAAHLRARGSDVRIFGAPMGSWRSRMPAGMYLKSEGCASSLSDAAHRFTLERYCRDRGSTYGHYAIPVSLDTFVQYGLAFQRKLLPDVEDRQVISLAQHNAGFEIAFADSARLRVRRVVVAVGLTYFEHIPPMLARLPADLVSHSSHHADLGQFQGHDVAVVGGGQSALETAALLRESGANVRVLVRRQRVAWNDVPSLEPRSTVRRLRRPMNGLGPGWRTFFYAEMPMAFRHLPEETRIRAVQTALGPAGAWWLRPRLGDHVPVLTGRVVSAADRVGDRVRLRLERAGEDAEEIVTDHVISATGYRVDLESLPFMQPALRARVRRVGRGPALSSAFESSVPGLFFIGQAAAESFGPVMRFVYGADFTARRVSRRLASDPTDQRSWTIDGLVRRCRG
jgi:FAD-dependent urate hydroxylase